MRLNQAPLNQAPVSEASPRQVGSAAPGGAGQIPVRAWPELRALLWQRSRKLFWLKFLGTSAFMWVFFEGYFHLLRHPARAVLEMPLTWLDRSLPFQPYAMAFYVSLWFYVGLAPGLLQSLRELIGYGLWVGSLCLAGLACFYFYPTAIPAALAARPDSAAGAFLQGVDAAGNACPSLHVATAVYSGLWLDRLLRELRSGAAVRLGNAAWSLLIVYSTLAVKQHVVIDVLAGLALGAGFAILALRCRGAVPAPGAAI
jgi:membrane-associated phospholipid phosphatase